MTSPSKRGHAILPVDLSDLDDLEVILVGYDRQTSPGAVELSDAVYVFNDSFGSVVGTVFTLEVVDPDSVSNLYFHNSLNFNGYTLGRNHCLINSSSIRTPNLSEFSSLVFFHGESSAV